MKAFDHFKYYFSIKEQINSTTEDYNVITYCNDENGNKCTYNSSEWYISHFFYFHYVVPFGYNFLLFQSKKMQNPIDNELNKILHICKIYENESRELFDEMCHKLRLKIDESTIKKVIPCNPYTLKIFISEYDFVRNNIDDFIINTSAIITHVMYEADTSASYKYLNFYFDATLKAIRKLSIPSNQISQIMYQIKHKVDVYCERLKIKDNIIPDESENQISDNGKFQLSWKYVTFTNGYIYLYHPLHQNSPYPLKYKMENSIGAFNSIQSYFINRLPPISVQAKNGRIIKVLNIEDVEFCIQKLTAKYKNRNNRPISRIPKHKIEKMTQEQITNHIHTYKSKYLDWLCSKQLPNYQIYYCLEIKSNVNQQEKDEDAFIFTIKETNQMITLVYENVLESRSSIVFKIRKNRLPNVIQEIHHFFSSNSFNKRELIMQGNVSNEFLFSSNTYWRIMHTNFNSWKSKIEETYNPFIV